MRRIMIHDIIDIQLNNSPTCLISSPEAWKLEGRGLEALRWVDLTRGPNAARFNSIQLAMANNNLSITEALRERDAVWGLKLRSRYGYSHPSSRLVPSPPPNSLAAMLDDYTLKVSFLGGFLVAVAFFVSRYFSLTNDPEVRSSPSYLRHT
jgi:hypothetical protein